MLRKAAFVLVFSALSLSAIAAEPPATKTGQSTKTGQASEKDVNAIRKNWDAFVEAWNKHDPNAMAAAWAENASLLNPFGREAQGRAEVVQLFRDEQTGVMKSSHASIEPPEVTMLAPDLAFVETRMTVSGMQPPGKKGPAETKKFHVVTISRNVDDKWQVEKVRAYAFLPPPGNAPVGRRPGQ